VRRGTRWRSGCGTCADACAHARRYETTALPPGELTGLEAALERTQERTAAAAAADGAAAAASEHKRIYYIVAQTREAAEASPYLEAFRARGIEVLLLFTPADEIVCKMLGVFQNASLVSAEEADLSLEAPAPASADDAAAGPPLDDAQLAALCDWLREGALAGKVAGVRASARLTDSAAVIVGHMPESLRKLQAVAAGRMDPSAAALLGGMEHAWLEVNPKHPLIKRLAAAAAAQGEGAEAKHAMAALVGEQVLDSARIAAGALDDPRSMLNRLTNICSAALA
jgi:HSP90 family molecular chaperone